MINIPFILVPLKGFVKKLTRGCVLSTFQQFSEAASVVTKVSGRSSRVGMYQFLRRIPPAHN